MADMRQNHCGGGPGDAVHRVMFGHPEPFVARGFGGPCQIGAGGIGLCQTAAFADWNQVENGQGDHLASICRDAGVPDFGRRYEYAPEYQLSLNSARKPRSLPVPLE